MRGEDNLYLKSIFRYRFNSLLTKIFISYMLILLVVAAAGIAIYFYVGDILGKKETNVSKEYLNYVSRIVDGELLHVKERMYGFLQSPEVAGKLNSVGKDISSQLNVVDGLSNLRSNSQMISDLELYNPQLPFVLSYTGTNDKDYLFKQLAGEGSMDGSSVKNILDSVKDFRIVSGNKDNGSAIALIAGVNYSSNPNRLIAFIDEKEIYNVITNTSIIKYGSAYMIDQDGVIMSGSEENKTGSRMDKGLLDKIKTGDGELSLHDNGNLVVYEKSSFFDGFYVTVIPNKNIMKETDTIRNIFIYVFASMILIGAGIAGLYSRSIYGPIFGLIAKIKVAKQTDSDYKNEIDWISGFIEHIQSSNSRYEEEVFLGRILEADSFGGDVLSLFPHTQFQAAVIVSGQSVKVCAHVKELLKKAPPDGFIAKVSVTSEGECYFVANGEELSPAVVKQYLSDLKAHLDSTLNLFTVIGLGDPVHEIDNLSVSLKNALTAVKQGSGYDETFIMEYVPDTDETFHIYFPIEFDNRIMDALTVGSEEKVSHLIHHIFDQNKELPQLYLRIIYTKFIDTYMMIANKCGQKYTIHHITENVEHEYRAVRVKAFMTKLFLELIPKFQMPMDTAKRVEIFVIQYIERNYNKDLTIEEMAEALHLSAPYVSTLFKKATGIAFSQYLLEFRLKKAMQLLIETDYSVKDISQLVCAGTYNSFIRSFRTLIGYSPGEYRTLYQQRKEYEDTSGKSRHDLGHIKEGVHESL